jgi:hypothetical protein
MSKLRADDARHVYARLGKQGAPPIRSGETGRADRRARCLKVRSGASFIAATIASACRRRLRLECDGGAGILSFGKVDNE